VRSILADGFMGLVLELGPEPLISGNDEYEAELPKPPFADDARVLPVPLFVPQSEVLLLVLLVPFLGERDACDLD
jgi:hypothetical protein